MSRWFRRTCKSFATTRPAPRNRARSAAGLSVALLSAVLLAHGQQSPSSEQPLPPPAWETAAGGHQEFDVISIRLDKNDDDAASVNVPYGPDDTYTNTGGVFRTTNWPVFRLINFAYKGRVGQRETFRSSLPSWAIKDGFNIEARSDNRNATKDQMRLMVRSMLEERFHLKIHYESRTTPVNFVELLKPGTLGPQLRPHPSDDSCTGANAAVAARPAATEEQVTTPAPAAPRDAPYPVLPGGFPLRCGTYVNMPPSQDYMRHEGGRDLTMAQIVGTFTGMGNLGKPTVDHTGLTGTYDWVMEFIDERDGHTPPPDAAGPTFLQALAKQNGLKLVPGKRRLRSFWSTISSIRRRIRSWPVSAIPPPKHSPKLTHYLPSFDPPHPTKYSSMWDACRGRRLQPSSSDLLHAEASGVGSGGL